MTTTPRSPHPWTRSEADASIAAYRARIGRPLCARDFRNNPAIPSMHTVYKLYGSLHAVTGHTQGGNGHSPRTTVSTPQAILRPGERQCLQCDRIFLVDARFTRVCWRCKQTDEWRHSRDWMNGI